MQTLIGIFEVFSLIFAGFAACFLYWSPKVKEKWPIGWRRFVLFCFALGVIGALYLKGFTGKGIDDYVAIAMVKVTCELLSGSSLCQAKVVVTSEALPPVSELSQKPASPGAGKFQDRYQPPPSERPKFWAGQSHSSLKFLPGIADKRDLVFAPPAYMTVFDRALYPALAQARTFSR